MGGRADLLSAARGAHDSGESRVAIRGTGSAARGDQHSLAITTQLRSAPRCCRRDSLPSQSDGSARGSVARRRLLVLEVFQHREHASVIAGGLQQVELSEDALHVLLDRAYGEHERLGDAGV